MSVPVRYPPPRLLALALTLVIALGWRSHDPSTPSFMDDDPLQVDDDMALNAAQVAPQELSQAYDFLENTFAVRGDRRDIAAANVNTVDEVPDSSWFVDRIARARPTAAALARGPNTRDALPARGWTIVAGKNAGLQPGFRAVVTGGDRQLYQLEFDPPGYPGLATGAELIGTLLYHAIGYHVVENYLVVVDPATLTISPDATYRERDGRARPFTTRTLRQVLARAARNPDGTYRALASRFAAGRPVGAFRYYGTRPDDPNDIYPHEHRRELRGARVFAAWVNHDDSRANNTLDMLEGDGTHQAIRHYMFDFGSIMGSGTTGPDAPRSGRAFLIDGASAWRILRTFGMWAPEWARRRAPTFHPSAGPFFGDGFDPAAWRAEYPNAAFANMRVDDAFWAARRVAAFTDEDLRLIVAQARYGDEAAAAQIHGALAARRDAIARTWLTAVTPIVSPSMAGDRLHFANAAVDAGVASRPAAYAIQWQHFDNTTGEHVDVGPRITVTSPSVPLPEATAAFLAARVSAVHEQFPAWTAPVTVYLRRDGPAWRVVGLRRQLVAGGA